MKRLYFLDGLRGWAAVFVLLFHVFSDGMPVTATSGDALRHLMFFNGGLAVMMFFLVSGFSLSTRYLTDGDKSELARIAAGRYLRLAIPIFATCLIVDLSMRAGLIASPEDRIAPFGLLLLFDPSAVHLLRFSLFDVFFNYRFSETYAGPLWTMSIELAGSAITLFTVFVVRYLRFRSVFLIAISGLILIADHTSLLSLFPVGIMIADWFMRGRIDSVSLRGGIALLVAGCALSTVFPTNLFPYGITAAWALTVGSIAVPWMRRFLSGKFSRQLGKLSFPLYLMHGPVMSVIGEPLMRIAGGSIGGRIVADLTVIVCSIGAAYVFLPVNVLAIRASQRFGRLAVNALTPPVAAPAPD
jgi:peptidoglycan/LPS O-acetylase OafA/YrhL